MSKYSKKQIAENSTFLIPLENGHVTVGFFHKYFADAMNSYLCSFYDLVAIDETSLPSNLSEANTIALLLVTRDLLDNGTWPLSDRFYFSKEKISTTSFDEKESFKGIKIIGSGIVRKFANAYFGLLPWDMMHDPNYFDKLMLPGAAQPSCRILSKN